MKKIRVAMLLVILAAVGLVSTLAFPSEPRLSPESKRLCIIYDQAESFASALHYDFDGPLTPRRNRLMGASGLIREFGKQDTDALGEVEAWRRYHGKWVQPRPTELEDGMSQSRLESYAEREVLMLAASYKAWVDERKARDAKHR